jgi:DNA polymerase-3 subunit epsilon
MLEQLDLDCPLACFDIESTGISPRNDRIVELAIVRVHPGGRTDQYVRRVNPGMPIPPGATAIHGITDEDVRTCPPFSDIAGEVLDQLTGCDLAGYNLGRFDIPMLTEELLRCGHTFNLEGRRIIDPQTIFHRHEPRDLSAALAFYCNELHLNAHGAEADVLATLRVLEGQLQRYSDLPHDVSGLDRYCNPRDPDWVDRTGRLSWQNGEVCVNFGRKRGQSIRQLIDAEPNYIKWLLRSDFPRDVIEIVQNALEGRWPEPPAADTSA